MKLHGLIAITVSIGCGSHETKTEPTTAPAPAAPTAAAPPATPTPPAPAGPKGLSFAWPPGGTSKIVASDDGAKLEWSAGGKTGSINLPRAAASGATKDVTKDGAPELVVFAAPPAKAPEWFEDQTMTWIIGVEPKSGKPARMWLLETQVLGATDAASLDRELGTVGTFGDPKAAPAKLIARLPNATPAELQALVGKAGLKLCKRQGEKKSCKPVAQKAVDAKRLAEIVKQGGVIATFEPDPDAQAEALQPPDCQVDEKDAKRLNCSSSIGGPAGGSWVFEKTDAGLRLAEVWAWAEDS